MLTSPMVQAMLLVQSLPPMLLSQGWFSIILSIRLQLADFGSISTEVKKQAFVAATQVNNPVTDYGGNGVLGIGFTRLSSIDMAVNNTGGSWGRSLMYNMFAMNASQPNLVAVLLERTTDTANQTQGMFTIGTCLHS